MRKDRPPKKSEFLSIRVPKEVKTRLEEMALSQERSLSWLVAKILEDFTAKRLSKK